MSDQMRGQLTFDLPGRDKKYIAKELTVSQIRSLFELDQWPEDDSLDGLIQHFGGVLLPLTTNITVEELNEFLPSELKLIYEKVREANAVFFDTLGTAGAGELLNKFKSALLTDCLSSFVTSLSAATLSTPSGDGDTPTS